MQGIIRLPTDLNQRERYRYKKAVDIWASAEWVDAIKICCNDKDMDSLCQFPYIQVLADIFFRKDIPIFKMEKE